MAFLDQINQIAGAMLGNRPTLDFTVHICRELLREGIRGDFVECGVFAGAHPAAMALTLRQVAPREDRRVHLFDSFQGIPEAGPKDDETITGCVGPAKAEPQLVSTGISACSVDQVKANMRAWGVDSGMLWYYPGWFQRTLPAAAKELAARGIALLRLDGDLYESTRVCLEHLHPLVPKGGVVIIDDYALTGCRRAVDEYLAVHGIRPSIQTIKGGSGPVWYRK